MSDATYGGLYWINTVTGSLAIGLTLSERWFWRAVSIAVHANALSGKPLTGD